MNIKNIKTLAKLLDESGLSAIEVTEGESTIRLERNIISNTVIQQGVPVAAGTVSANTNTVDTATGDKETAIDFNNVSEFRSPIIGVFYNAPSPEDKPFVEVGSRVKKGDVLCIVEAMKVLNEITCDRDGTIVDICVQTGQVVEYSQVLFKIH